MQSNSGSSNWKVHAILHAAFAVTGVAHIISGALMPSIAATFHLDDRQSGLLFLLYFGGSAVGAFLCRGNYARSQWVGFSSMALSALGVSLATSPVLPVAFLLFGVSVGMPMSAVSLYVGRNMVDRRAAMLTVLNFTWSCGALFAPLLAGRILAHHSYRAAYFVISAAALLSALACGLALRDGEEHKPEGRILGTVAAWRLILIFGAVAFLQVGVENTSAAWLPTFVMRTADRGVVVAAYASSLYWVGFLASRGASSWLLLNADMNKVLRASIIASLCFAVLLLAAPSAGLRTLAMFLLGASLAPTYPLVLAAFFARARYTGDSRWILATAGFGGSLLPWLAGSISAQVASLRTGMLVMPAALFVMAAALPVMTKRAGASLTG